MDRRVATAPRSDDQAMHQAQELQGCLRFAISS